MSASGAAPLARPGEALLRAGVVPCPPGEFFDERFLKPKGISVHQASAEMQIGLSYLCDFIEGRGRVDRQFAHKLAMFTGTTVGFWLNMQSASDLADDWKPPQ